MREYFEQLEKESKIGAEDEGFVSSDDSKDSENDGSFTPFGGKQFKKINN